jgi:hypothetical protein
MSFENYPPVTATGDVTGSLPGPLTLSPAADYALSSAYMMVMAGLGGIGGNLSAGTYPLAWGTGGPLNVNAAAAGAASFYLNPLDFPAGTKTLYLRIRLSMFVNNTAPGAGTWTADLRPITAPAGAAASTVTITAGAAVAGSSAVVTSPAANSQTNVDGSDFAFPAAGWYAVCITNSANYGSANGGFLIRADLQRRAV